MARATIPTMKLPFREMIDKMQQVIPRPKEFVQKGIQCMTSGGLQMSNNSNIEALANRVDPSMMLFMLASLNNRTALNCMDTNSNRKTALIRLSPTSNIFKWVVLFAYSSGDKGDTTTPVASEISHLRKL